MIIGGVSIRSAGHSPRASALYARAARLVVEIKRRRYS